MATASKDNEPKISWAEYQKRNKWFLLGFIMITLGIICLFVPGAGKDAAIFFFAVGAILIVYGGILKWLEYKHGRNS